MTKAGPVPVEAEVSVTKEEVVSDQGHPAAMLRLNCPDDTADESKTTLLGVKVALHAPA